jgi:hypothetical protein
MQTTRANIIILSGAKMTVMNGEIRANIPMRRVPGSLKEQLFFCQRPSKTEALLTRVENECEEK